MGCVFSVLVGSTPSVAAGEQPVAAPLPEQACRVFPVTVDDGQGGYFETGDRTGTVGQWVGGMEDAGWTLVTVDFESGTKPTGFPVHHVMVCLTRSRAR